MHSPSTLCLAANHNQQNILNITTPVLPSILAAKFNTYNCHRKNFNSENKKGSLADEEEETLEMEKRNIFLVVPKPKETNLLSSNIQNNSTKKQSPLVYASHQSKDTTISPNYKSQFTIPMFANASITPSSAYYMLNSL